MEKWKRPDSYFGPEFPEYFVFLAKHRDSEALPVSNFRSALKALGGESKTVLVERAHHWAVGWIECILIHESDTKAIQIATEIENALTDYPVVNDEDFTQLEDEWALETWRNDYNHTERVEYIKENKSQFEFPNYAAMISCVRGNSFYGYSSELLD